MNGGGTYLERPLPSALILGSFLFCAVPLALLQLIPNFVGWIPALTLLVAVGLGTSHFFLTLAVYLEARHRRYFTSSWQRRLTYFALPIFILLLLAFVEAGELRVRDPAAAAYFFVALRTFDFVHVGRQSFGVLQLVKRPLAAAAPRTRGLENAFFVGMAAMQWQTYVLGGSFPGLQLRGFLPALALFGLFVFLFAAYARRALLDWQRGYRPWLYFTIQAICSAAAVYRTWLYLTVLAVHYLEYHVLMYPRLFRAQRQDSAPRALGRVLGPWVFYSVLASVVIAFELRRLIVTESAAWIFVVHSFDGIFLLHYVLDAFLWRFGNPFYREQLGPLYFGPAPDVQRPGRQPWAAALAGGLIAIGLAALAGTEPGRRLVQAAFDPIHAQNHARWGLEYLEQGNLADGRKHLEEALRRDPQQVSAREGLRWIDGQAAGSAADVALRPKPDEAAR